MYGVRHTLPVWQSGLVNNNSELAACPGRSWLNMPHEPMANIGFLRVNRVVAEHNIYATRQIPLIIVERNVGNDSGHYFVPLRVSKVAVLPNGLRNIFHLLGRKREFITRRNQILRENQRTQGICHIRSGR